MPYRDAFAWSLRQLVQSGKTEVVLGRRFAPRRLLGPRIMIRKGDFDVRTKSHSPLSSPGRRMGDLVTLWTDGVECSLRNFRVIGYSFPAKLLALRTILRWCRSTRMIPLAKGIPIRISAQE